jgi:anaerobic selenocysteine-containing dehydrogenase
MREEFSFCRICAAQCGVRIAIDDNENIVSIRGDKSHELTSGYACSKGVNAGAMHSRPDRVLRPLKRLPDGRIVEISLELASAEIADGLSKIIEREGPEAIAMYCGTHSFYNITVTKLLQPFMRAIGSPNRYTPLTIDNVSTFVRMARMGIWGGGPHRFDNSDVWLLFGTNPLLSLCGQAGLPPFNSIRRLKAAKARGLKLIVVDSRRTETAQYADLFLQVKPGEDSALIACMLHIILDENLHDREYCSSYVEGLDQLRAAVAPFTPEYAAMRVDIPVKQIYQAARMFAGPGKRGCAGNGTGVTMSPTSNLTDHMMELLNVLCGRMLRAGETVTYPGPLDAPQSVYEEVIRPSRCWESGPKMRIRGYGMMQTPEGGEWPCAALPDEILQPGKGQIKSLLSIGGNPGSAFPNQTKIVEALRSLELLVAVEPFMTTTARLAHYVIPPRLLYERVDLQPIWWQSARVPVPFAQYTPAIITPPAGSDVAEEWHFIWDIARRMGKQLKVCGQDLDMEKAPTSDELLDIITAGTQIPLDEVRRHPRGKIFDIEQVIQPRRADSTARFAVMPDDVAEELTRFRATVNGDSEFTHLLTARRTRAAMNSIVPGAEDARSHYNPAYMHSSELAALQVKDGDRVEIVSDTGRLTAIVATDDTLRTGVVSMTHGYGGLPDDPANGDSACTSLLVSHEHDCQPISAMPRMTAIPVRIKPSGSVPLPRV